MSSFQSDALSVPAAVESGTPITVNPRSPLLISLGNSGSDPLSATMKIQYSQVSADPDTSPDDVWHDVGAALTAAGFRVVPAGRAKRVRVKTTVYSTGAPIASVFHDLAGDIGLLERDFEEATVDVPLSVTAGTGLVLNDGEEAVCHVRGTFSATIQIQISATLDGDIWHNYGPAITAAGFFRVPKGMAQRIRANVTSYTSGTPIIDVLKGFRHEQGDDDVVETVTSGALSLFARTSLLSCTGTVAYTLADGLYEGQRKSVIVTVAATTPRGTLTLAHSADSFAPVLTSVGQRLEYEWHASGWRLISYNSPSGSAVDTVTSGAISVNTLVTNVSVDGTKAYTLADGLFVGQLKYLFCSAAANTPAGTITPATPSGFSSVAMNAVGDSAIVMWTGAAWILINAVSLTIS